MRTIATLLVVCAALGFAPGCRQDMQDQPRYKTLSECNFFPDRRSERPLVAGTVARGRLFEDELLNTGKIDGKLADVLPFPVTKEVLERGHDRFNIFCSPCHDRTGNGNGMIVQRGMKRPPSYHIQRLREAPVGYFFDVMTNGFGAMYDQSDRIPVDDRWKIAAYIRALQLSENATLADVPQSEIQKLQEAH